MIYDLVLVLFRSFLLGLAAAGLGKRLGAALRGGRTAWLRLLILAPLFTPMVLPAYAWSNFATVAVWPKPAAEALYFLLNLARWAPLAALISAFAPPRDGEARHGLNLLRPKLGRNEFLRRRLALWWHGDGLVFRTAFAVVALLTFDEFELASFLPVVSWTVPLFDAHAGGLPLAETFRHALPSLLAKLPFWILLATGLPALARRTDSATPGTYARLRGAVIWVMAALALVLARQLSKSGTIGRIGFGLGLLMVLPGPLPMGLALLSLFQTQLLNPLYDTPAALITGWTLLLLPLALLLVRLVHRWEDPAALHAASLLPPDHARRLRLRLRAGPWLAAGLALTALAAPELTLSAMLASPATPTAATRLYNFMHYGQNGRLSAMILLSMLPLFLAVIPLLRLLARRETRV